jgi:hypothetical protein
MVKTAFSYTLVALRIVFIVRIGNKIQDGSYRLLHILITYTQHKNYIFISFDAVTSKIPHTKVISKIYSLHGVLVT